MRRHWAAILAVVVAVNGFVYGTAEPAAAWKPPTHLYGVWIAVQDLLDDGVLEFETLDGDVYTAMANPILREAVEKNLPAFYAGAVGPDAYPDMLFGQGLIHPDTVTSNGARPEAEAAPPPLTSQSYMWADHLWKAAWTDYGTAFTDRDREAALTNIAFALGYAAGHFNGDVWAHTWVNSFAGGVFPDFTDLGNADISIRHVIVEGYVDKHRPGFETDGGFAVDAPEGFVADQLIFSDFARSHADPMLIIGMFGTMSERIESRIEKFEYDIKTQDCLKLTKEGTNCVEQEVPGGDGETGFVCRQQPCVPDPTDAPLDLVELASLELRLEYSRAWLRDIHTGLEDWVAIWDDIARETFSGGKPEFSVVKEHIERWVFKHFLSMLGLPDFVGGGIYAGIKGVEFLIGLWGSVTDWLWDQAERIPGIGELIRWVREQINLGVEKLKDKLLVFADRIAGLLVTGALGITCAASELGEEYGIIEDAARSCLSGEVFEAIDTDRNGILRPSELFRVFEEPEEFLTDDLFQEGARARIDAAMALPEKCADFDGSDSSAEAFCDYNRAAFAPLANTTVLAKLGMLDHVGLNELIRDMAGDQQLEAVYEPVLASPISIPGNVMLGWAKSIDGEFQWRTTSPVDGRSYGTGEMWLWEDCVAREAVFRRLFREPVPEVPGMVDFVGKEPVGPPPWDADDVPTGLADAEPPVTEVLYGSPQVIVDGVVYVTSGTDLRPIASDNHYPGSDVLTWLRMYLAGTLEANLPEYRLAGTEPSAGPVPFRLQGVDAEWVIEFFSVDDGGLCNIEPPRSIGVRLDNSPPVINVAQPTTPYQVGSSIVFDFEADDGSGAGVELVYATFAGFEVEPGSPVPTLGMAPGSYLLSITAIDPLGNRSWDNSTEVLIVASDAPTVDPPPPDPDPIVVPGEEPIDEGAIESDLVLPTEPIVDPGFGIQPLAAIPPDQGISWPWISGTLLGLVLLGWWIALVVRKRRESSTS